MRFVVEYCNLLVDFNIALVINPQTGINKHLTSLWEHIYEHITHHPYDKPNSSEIVSPLPRAQCGWLPF